jgi:hypothetical protein
MSLRRVIVAILQHSPDFATNTKCWLNVRRCKGWSPWSSRRSESAFSTIIVFAQTAPSLASGTGTDLRHALLYSRQVPARRTWNSAGS